MLNPLELTTTGLVAAVTNRTLPQDYRETCIAELAARIDRPSTAQRPMPTDHVNPRKPKAA
jgi:hypothetical protein